MCASFSVPLPKLNEGRPSFIPGQHHAQSRWQTSIHGCNILFELLERMQHLLIREHQKRLAGWNSVQPPREILYIAFMNMRITLHCMCQDFITIIERVCMIDCLNKLSGLYHDAVIATNLALRLSPNLVVSPRHQLYCFFLHISFFRDVLIIVTIINTSIVHP